jgi:hypothetical protein
MFVDLAAAVKPLGLLVDEPPRASVAKGSVQFGVSGGLFATGLGLLVACSAGLVGAPVWGPIAGGAIAAAGGVDLALNWRKILTESRKADAEARLARIELRIKELELEKARLSAERASERSSSALVPRDLVKNEAKSAGMSEAHANHLLNRTLPGYLVLREKMVGWTIIVEPSKGSSS